MEIQLTPKQAEYVREARHRWNVAAGAVRSGKSRLAVQYTIPDRLLAMRDLPGLAVVLGVTRESIERNVLEPMRDIWGDDAVSDISARNTAQVFGQRVYCIGAEKRSQVSKLRGSEIKFCYCDEICDINEEVFEMLKSRLSLPYSECHMACNPAGPNHFVKRFIDSASEGVDVWAQRYTIYDNPFLPPEYVRSLEAEYRGTVYFKRYILGLWALAEGLVYPMYESAVEPTYSGEVRRHVISVDYGTQNPFVALDWAEAPDGSWHLVRELYHSGRETGHQKTDADYVADVVAFAEGCGHRPTVIVDPSATSFIAALRRSGEVTVRKARNSVEDGIRDTAVCLQTGRARIGEGCRRTLDEIAGYSWDESSSGDRPVKEDDHCMDAMRYLVETMGLRRPRETYVSRFGDR